jgi:hypothetical protein
MRPDPRFVGPPSKRGVMHATSIVIFWVVEIDNEGIARPMLHYPMIS